MSALLRLAMLAVTLSLVGTVAWIGAGDLASLQAAAAQFGERGRNWLASLQNVAPDDDQPDRDDAAASGTPNASPPTGPLLARPKLDPIVRQSEFLNVAAPQDSGADDEKPAMIESADPSVSVHRVDTSAALNSSGRIDRLVVRNQDITKVLELLSEASHRKILASKKVSGPITIALYDTTIDEAFEKILKISGLVSRLEGDYTLVYTPEELKDVEEHAQKPQIRIYKPRYISAADLEEIIAPHLSESGKISRNKANKEGIGANSDQAGGDSVAIADMIVVRDIEPVLQEIDRIVAEADVRPPQVLVEAVILSVDLDDNHRMGVNFALLSGQSGLSLFGDAAVINAAAGFRPSTLVTGDGKLQSGFVDGTHGLKYGVIRGDLTGFIRLLETVGHTSILASPKVPALNKQRAEILVGGRIGYRTTTATETFATETVQFLDVGTQLRVRPFVLADGLIRMELHPERSSGQINPQTNAPDQDTTSVTTNVTVCDGMTIVIGGLIEEVQERTVQQVPFLGSLPLVGGLFRDETTSTKRRELIMLITPRIIDDAGSMAAADTQLQRFADRSDSLEQVFPPHTRVALARKYYQKACDYRDQGDRDSALEMVTLALHFDPFDAPAIKLREELLGLYEAAPDEPAAPSSAHAATRGSAAGQSRVLAKRLIESARR